MHSSRVSFFRIEPNPHVALKQAIKWFSIDRNRLHSDSRLHQPRCGSNLTLVVIHCANRNVRARNKFRMHSEKHEQYLSQWHKLELHFDAFEAHSGHCDRHVGQQRFVVQYTDNFVWRKICYAWMACLRFIQIQSSELLQRWPTFLQLNFP